jgi:hypothetical protein
VGFAQRLPSFGRSSVPPRNRRGSRSPIPRSSRCRRWVTDKNEFRFASPVARSLALGHHVETAIRQGKIRSHKTAAGIAEHEVITSGGAPSSWSL